jgi:Tol biopolymer transport system component
MNTNLNTSSKRRGIIASLLLSAVMVLPIASATSAQISPVAGCLSWTADNSGIVYCNGSASGGSELFEQDLDGSVRQLTFLGGKIESADVSSDGSMVTFHATLPTDATPQVYVIDRHGPRLRKVLVGPEVIEIGRRSVMVGGSLIDVSGALPRQLTEVGSNSHPSFAPTDDRIGFTTDRQGALSLWSMSLDGSDQRQMLVASVD